MSTKVKRGCFTSERTKQAFLFDKREAFFRLFFHVIFWLFFLFPGSLFRNDSSLFGVVYENLLSFYNIRQIMLHFQQTLSRPEKKGTVRWHNGETLKAQGLGSLRCLKKGKNDSPDMWYGGVGATVERKSW